MSSTERQDSAPTEERFDYGDGVAFQRPCDAGCDRGLLLAPARFCARCGGSGYLVRWEGSDAAQTEQVFANEEVTQVLT